MDLLCFSKHLMVGVPLTLVIVIMSDTLKTTQKSNRDALDRFSTLLVVNFD